MKRAPLKRKTPLKAKSALKRGRGNGMRNPVPTANDICIICGRPFAHSHEVFYGTANRKQSMKHGLKVRLCDECHEGTSGVHGRDGYSLGQELKQKVQELFEQEHTRDEFMAIIGRNYLDNPYKKPTDEIGGTACRQLAM